MRQVIRVLLWVLNSRFVNRSPCQFGYVNNIDAFSCETLAYEEKMRPGVTVKQILEDADRWKSCPMKNQLTVIEPDGTTHEATVWDRHELNLALTPSDQQNKA